MARRYSLQSTHRSLLANLPRLALSAAVLALLAVAVRAAASAPQGPSAGRVRWSVLDGGDLWVPDDVSLGDDGAAAFAGLLFNTPDLKLFAGGSPTPVFETLPDVGLSILQAQVDIAASAPVAVSLTTHQTNGSSQDPDIVAIVRAYDLAGDARPLWERQLPTSDWNTQTGVAVSDEGAVVLTWWSVEDLGGMLVTAFDESGKMVSQGVIERPGSSDILWPDEAVLSRDGSTAMFSLPLRDEVVLYDVRAGAVKASVPDNGIFQGHAMSRDGRRLASVTWELQVGYRLRVHELDAQGALQQVFERVYPDSVRVPRVALDLDGSRLAWAVMAINPSDEFTVVVHDLDADVELFARTFAAPGTTLGLWVTAMELDDAGETLAIASYGDSLGATPEVIVLDALGDLLVGVDARGSALHLDLSPDGELLFAGCKATHANVLGSGGDLYMIETRAQELRVEGQPRLGGSLDLAVRADARWDRALVVASQGLLPVEVGGLRLDFSAGRRLVGAYALVNGEHDAQLAAPTNLALAGEAVHYQALLVDDDMGARAWTNKVSTRLLP